MIFSGVSWLAFSQQDPVLMRVNGKDVLRSEFEYYYNTVSYTHLTLPTIA